MMEKNHKYEVISIIDENSDSHKKNIINKDDSNFEKKEYKGNSKKFFKQINNIKIYKDKKTKKLKKK